MEFSEVVLAVLGCLILSGWIAALVIARKKKIAEKKLVNITSAFEERGNKINELDAAIQRLSKYQAIEDAELEAERIVFEAKKKGGQLWQDAERESTSHLKAAFSKKENAEFEAANIKRDADEKWSQIIAEARREASEIRDRAKLTESKSQSLIEEAHVRSEKIISNARFQAEETAGNAIKAVENAKLYEQTAKAMKNIIEGYHDDYIVPNASLLDDLAEGFSHKDAGQKLKQSRKHSADMAKNGRAGDCDYVEKVRREYAIHFAVDAFNGKVDSILSKVKHDNYGKLKQGVLDAFALVNHNGQPFKTHELPTCICKPALMSLSGL